MAIDPNISLGFRPPQVNLDVPSPIHQMGQMMTLRGLMEQQQLRRSQIEQEQYKLESLREANAGQQEFMRRARAGENLTPGQTYGMLGPKVGTDYLKGQSELEEQRIKANAARMNRLGSIIGSATDTPTFTRAVMQAHSEGYFDAEQARHFLQGGYDPARVKQYRDFAMTAEQQNTAALNQIKADREAKESAARLASEQAQGRLRGLEYAAQTAPNDPARWAEWRAQIGQTNPEALPLIPPQHSPAAYQLVRQFGAKPPAPQVAMTPEAFEQQQKLRAPQPTPPMSPERFAQDVKLAQTRGAAAAGGAGAGDVATNIAEGIITGNQPPNTQGLYRYGAQVRSELQKRGYDLATAQRDWEGVKRHMATLNGPQQERLRQAVDFTYHSLDQIDSAYDRWRQAGLASGFKVLNRGALATMANLPGEAGSAATQLQALIADMTSELGTVYKGGNGATDETLRLAAHNLSGDWNEQQFKDAVQRIRGSLQIRRNSMLNSQAAGVSSDSPYVQRPPAETPAPSTKKVKVWNEKTGRFEER